MSNHTPGPWGSFRDDLSPYCLVGGASGNGAIIAEVYGENDDADARIMAAAPDLLDALDVLLARCQVLDEADCSTRELAQARAAIAKARG